MMQLGRGGGSLLLVVMVAAASTVFSADALYFLVTQVRISSFCFALVRRPCSPASVEHCSVRAVETDPLLLRSAILCMCNITTLCILS